MRPRVWMNETLVKSVSRCEFAPESHGVADVTPWNVRTCLCRNNAVALHPEAIRTGSFVFLLPIDSEVSARGRFGGNADRTGNGHQGAIAFHHVNILFRQDRKSTRLNSSH